MMKNLVALLVFTMTQIVFANTSYEACSIPRDRFVVLSEANIIKELGRPHYKENFKIKDGMNEFRIELLNIYTQDRRANDEVRIWEHTWRRGYCRITIWFHWANGQRFSILNHGWHKNEES